MFLYTESDKIKARKLKDYLQGRLRNLADLRAITEISAEEDDFRSELRCQGDCIVLVGSRHASSLINNKQQEAEDDFLTFDGKVYEEFTGNKTFIDKLVIVYLTMERAIDDWIPVIINSTTSLICFKGWTGKPTDLQSNYGLHVRFSIIILV